MVKDLVVAKYQEWDVSFSEEGWFNATEAAAKFGKRVSDWLENQETKEYIKALAMILNVPKERDLIRAKRGRAGGTWFHPALAVPFARWCDVTFSIWCDKQIREIIAGKHPHYDWKRVRHEAASSFKVMNQILQFVRDGKGKGTAPHHYANEAKLVNYALTGAFKGVDREGLPQADLDMLAKLEEKNSVLLGLGLDRETRKTILVAYAAEVHASRLMLNQGEYEEAAA